MLEIVLLILKIAGVILLSILGILIVLTGIVLFVPVRYRGDFLVSDKTESGKRAFIMKFRAAWFLRIVRVYATYEDKPRVRFKLLFFTLMDTAREKKTKRNGKEKNKEKTRKKAEEDTQQRTEGNTRQEAEESTQQEAEESIWQETDIGEDGAEPVSKEAGRAPDGKLKSKKKTIKSLISNILQTSREFCDKLRNIKKKTEKIEDLWKSGHMTNSRVLLQRQFCYLLKHTRPKKLSGYLRFGFDDPSITGYAMALYGILYAIWSPEVSVEPDFEKRVLDAHILLKGKIRVWHFVRVILRLLLSKDVRHVIEDVRNF